MLTRSTSMLRQHLRLARPRAATVSASAGVIGRRSYTNTAVYTRVDGMSHDELMKALVAEHQYLIELLRSDDSQAPWCRDTVETVSRTVQENPRAPQPWNPDQVFHG